MPEKNHWSCYVNFSFLHLSDVFHISNSIRFFGASVSFSPHTSSWQELFRESLPRLTLDLISWSHSLLSLVLQQLPAVPGIHLFRMTAFPEEPAESRDKILFFNDAQESTGLDNFTMK